MNHRPVVVIQIVAKHNLLDEAEVDRHSKYIGHSQRGKIPRVHPTKLVCSKQCRQKLDIAVDFGENSKNIINKGA